MDMCVFSGVRKEGKDDGGCGDGRGKIVRIVLGG